MSKDEYKENLDRAIESRKKKGTDWGKPFINCKLTVSLCDVTSTDGLRLWEELHNNKDKYRIIKETRHMTVKTETCKYLIEYYVNLDL